jgi:alginate O-acetyltransferase complex protein AlgJ
MGLLARYRRAWIAVFIGLLWVPILGQAIMPSSTRSEAEARVLRVRPSFPQSKSEWPSFPRAVDGFLADHFGFRDQLWHANALVRYQLSSSTSPLVLYGRNGYLFYLGNAAVEQSIGRHIRWELLGRFADFLAQMQNELSKRDTKFLVAFPPNNSTINRAQLPAWASTPPAITEYDVILQMLTARNVPAIDLRPALQAENAKRATYFQTDTHWNFLGAVVGRNEIVRAIGHPEWALDVDRVFRGFRRVYGRDLARFLGLPNDIPDDQDAAVDAALYPLADGPDILVIGDSFTYDFFPSIWRNGGKLTVIENPGCKLKFDAIVEHHPSIVIFTIVERSLGLNC